MRVHAPARNLNRWRLAATHAARLTLLIGAALLSQGVMWFGCSRDVPKMATIERVKDNLYVVKGGGGNTAVLVTDDGVVLVDTKLAFWGPALLAQIRTVTDKPITTIINTHTHGDHVGSNEYFPSATEIIAHENTAAHMREMNIFQGDRARFVPNRTFTFHLSLTKGRDQIELYHFGVAHTDGDTVVVFPQLHVMHVGDLFVGRTLPVIDDVHGGSGVAYPDTLDRLAASLADVDTVIPGHGPVTSRADIAEYAAFTRDFLAWTRAELAAGRSEEDATGAYRIPAAFKDYTRAPWMVKTNLELMYRELKPPSHATRWWGGVR